jgi:hypothetical protein
MIFQLLASEVADSAGQGEVRAEQLTILKTAAISGPMAGTPVRTQADPWTRSVPE